MDTLTISPKYQVVIPKVVREALHLRAGQKVQVIAYDGRIELIPERKMQEMRGFLAGIDPSVPREGDRV
ncbi:transcriptional regulator, AbrB family [Thioalkalivibrio sp. K90mix]|uniref:AbrB/MazE/SpoVT family DNA-binding domain-containing protein n=1 Tax=Thioalkalivibrio sp. (strain K90mix) TaxID=396595 RepID=UPI000195A664|nr:AbrB/MazE/SpoVT family DNA-binding domain-containing protein [Thioalkalivibrio sp. K90mix]ADC72037.1 transcriptional regulator, AbrB family [Thioalkalivibrio sp. K90mix]